MAFTIMPEIHYNCQNLPELHLPELHYNCQNYITICQNYITELHVQLLQYTRNAAPFTHLNPSSPP